MYRNILVPVDFGHGDVGARILRLAREFAGPDGRVTLLHVVDALPAYVVAQIPEGTLEAAHAEARADLEALARDVDPEAAVALRAGSPATTILAEAKDIGADAILVGSHRPGMGDYFIGSTAGRVLRHAQCSVIVDRS